MNIFSENSLLGRSFGFLGQLIFLNILWIVCSVPVVTIGASTTAMYYCTLKLHKNGDCSPWKDFFRSFRQNFRQSTILWMSMLFLAGVFYAEHQIIPTMPQMSAQIFRYLQIAVCIPFVMVMLYMFPTLAAFDNKIKCLVLNSFYFAAKNILYFLAIGTITILPMFFTLIDAKLFPVYVFLWLMCGFSLTAYANSWFFWKLFRPYLSDGEGKNQQQGESDLYVF